MHASDASPAKGAIVSAKVSSAEAFFLLPSAAQKGGYLKLDAPARALLKGIGDIWMDEDLVEGLLPANSLPLFFDFVEVRGGSHYCSLTLTTTAASRTSRPVLASK